MPLIELETSIVAPIDRCLDLARSIDFHVATARASQETAIAGRVTGLIEFGETVTWRARHLGVWQTLATKITAFDRPRHFEDVMMKGAFAMMRHDHYFSTDAAGATLMTDAFEFRSPLGPLGALVDRLYLGSYMRRFLDVRARLLKATAESEDWRRYL